MKKRPFDNFRRVLRTKRGDEGVAHTLRETVTIILRDIPLRFGMAPIIIMAFSLVVVAQIIPGRSTPYLIMVGGSLLILAAGIEMFIYLQDSRYRFASGRYSDDVSKTRERLDQLTSALDALKVARDSTSPLSDNDRQQIRSDLIAKLRSELTAEAAREYLDTLKETVKDAQHIESVRGLTKAMQERLNDEVESLGSRANLQLTLGSSICVAGLGLLGYFVLTIPEAIISRGNNLEVAAYLLTRLSLFVFIEIFAYFFLRMYRHSMFEIKYFQNELTNSEFRVMALELALMKGAATTINKICMDLSNTERNFVLKKGDVTLTMRGEELERLSDQSFTGVVEKALERGQRGTSGKQEAAAT
jgi:hypothetical protein